jgi:hypothetical protein
VSAREGRSVEDNFMTGRVFLSWCAGARDPARGNGRTSRANGDNGGSGAEERLAFSRDRGPGVGADGYVAH